MHNKSTQFDKSLQSRVIAAPFPCCQQATCLKIYQPPQSKLKVASTTPIPRKTPSLNRSQQQNTVLSPNIQISKRKPSSMSFHHFKKFNSYDYQFESIFSDETKNEQIAQKIKYVQSIIDQENQICVMGLGGINSGLAELCEGTKDQQGLFSILLTALLEKLLSSNQKKNQNLNNNEYSEGNRLLFRFMAFYDDKIFDLLNNKGIVTLRQNGGRNTIVGSQCFQPLSVYDLEIKLSQLYKLRRQTFPESILVIECQLISQDYQQNRYLSLIQWQKSLKRSQTNKTHLHNNQSLLTFNKCIYELYKFSIRNAQTISEIQINQLWSQFRNSPITKFIKNYLVKYRKLAVFGCISTDEYQEEDNFQTLNICKNISKIKFQNLNRSRFNQRKDIQKVLNVSHTIRASSKVSKYDSFVTSPKQDEFVDLQRVKGQLKKILDEKKKNQEKEKEKSVIHMIRLQNRKKKDLSALRYKQEQIKIRSDFCSRSRVNSEQNDINLPTINSKQHQEGLKQMQELLKQQENKLAEVNDLHSKIVQKVKTNQDLDFSRTILETQIKMNEKQIIDFIGHKQKIIDILKREVKQIKRQQCEAKKQKPPATRKMILNSKRHTAPSAYIQKSQQKSHDQSVYEVEENPEPFKISEHTRPTKLPSLEKLKSANKQDYLFEKRRLDLKKKILRNKQQINKQFQQAALNFQKYPRTRIKTE